MLHSTGELFQIKRQLLKTQVYDYLKEKIINNEFDKNEIYSEQYFANILDVSRTPIREAILQLSHEKLIEILPNKGFSIREITEEELKEIYEIRKVIEVFCCIKLAKDNNSLEGKNVIKKLGDYIKNMENDLTLTNGSLALMDDDTDFHMEIVNYSNNRYMIDLILDLKTQIKSIGIGTFKIKGRKKSTIDEHYLILQALIKGDCEKASQAIENHLINAEDVLIKNHLLAKNKRECVNFE